MKKRYVLAIFLSVALLLASQPAFASSETALLKQQLEEMNRTMESLKLKIEAMEKEGEKEKEDVKYLGKRLDKAELHTATDKVSLGIELRSKADSIHYDGMLSAPASLVNGFFFSQRLSVDLTGPH